MEINYLAVVVAALSGFAVGAVWYGPLLGKQWMAVTGIKAADIADSNFPRIYGVTLLMSVVAAVVLEQLVKRFDANTVREGATLGALLWLGFIVTVRVTEAMFNRTSMRLVLIDSGHRLIWAVVMGIILAVWH